jgi:hypothetical protein
MLEAEAERILRERVDAGGRLVPVQRGDLCAIKSLRERCHAAGVPTLLVAAPGSG